jgi:hypothetical protein
MCPSFGVPWPRLERAAERLRQLRSPSVPLSRVQPLLFLCGLKYLLTYRAVNGRRLTHYVDDGLREAVEKSLPLFVALSKQLQLDSPVGRVSLAPVNIEFERVNYAFVFLNEALPIEVKRWAAGPFEQAQLIRLTFGMGVMARFAPESHTLVKRMHETTIRLSPEESDVLESFRWHSSWSVALHG